MALKSEFFKKGADYGENELSTEMNRYLDTWQNYQGQGNTKKAGKAWKKIAGLGKGGYGDQWDEAGLRESLFGGTYDPSQYAWGQGGGDTTPLSPTPAEVKTDVNLDTGLGDLTNMPQYSELSGQLPSWLDLGGDKNWKDIAQQGQIADWIESQMAQAGRDRAANVMGQQLQQGQELAGQESISEEDIQRILGGYAGRFADAESGQMDMLRENLGTRGIGAGSGVGSALGAQADLQRRMGMAGQEATTRTQADMENRSALERALGLQSSSASNLANILTGYGSNQWQQPAPDYWRTMQHPDWMTPKDSGTSWQDALGLGLKTASTVLPFV